MTETMFMILPIWLVAIIIGVPLYLAISLAGTAFVVINGIPALAVPQKIVMAANSFPLLAAPFFILMGNVMNYSGVTTRLFRFVSIISSWMRGGLAHANIIASVVFAGMSGSAVAVVAAAYALVVGGFVYRDFSLSDLPQVILSSVQTTGLVMALVMTAGLLGWALSVARIPFMVGSLLADVSHNPLIFLLIVNVSLLIVGLFMEAIAAMLILIPIFVPVALANGIDPTQFGVLFVLNLMIGTITPPVGVVLFLTASIADVPPERAIRAVIPFLIPLVVVLAAVTCIPSLTT